MTASKFKSKQGLRRILNAAGYSCEGLAAAYRTEAAFRQECFLALFMIPGVFFFPVSVTLKLMGVFGVVFVMVTELLNSGIEAAIDRIGMEIHPLSKYAKDIGSAAVMVAMLFCGLVWAVILWESFGHLI